MSEGPRARQHGLAAARRRHSTTRVLIKSITILCLILVIYLLSRRQQTVEEEKGATVSSDVSLDWTETHGRSLLAKRRKHKPPHAGGHKYHGRPRSPPPKPPDAEEDDDDKCAGVQASNVHDRCDYVRTHCGSTLEGWVDYLSLHYCTFKGMETLSMLVLVSAVLLFFYVLGETAESYFCPVVEKITELLDLAPTTAGVTFLAFGNGSPDVFSSLAAFVHGNPKIGLGAIVSAGSFVTAFVVGCVSVVAAPFTVEARSFVRDVVFFLVASSGVYLVCSLGSVRVWQAVLFCVYYVVYVTVVIISDRMSKATSLPASPSDVQSTSVPAEKERQQQQAQHQAQHQHQPLQQPAAAPRRSVPILATAEPGDLEELLAKHRDPLNFKRQVEVPPPHLDDWGDDALVLDLDVRVPFRLYYEEWREEFLGLRPAAKVRALLYLPFDVLRRATIPSVEDSQWNRLYATANVLLCPLVILDFCSGLVEFDHPIGFAFVGYFPLWGLVLIQSLILAVSLFVTTSSGQPPPHGRAPMVAGAFVMSIMWISTIANELLGCLNALGIIVGVSPSVLGVTVLAWGNSIGDLVADVAIARAGLPAMALSGCYAGPLFNMMVGLGLALTIKTIMIYPTPYKLHRHPNIPVAFGFLFASLVGSLTVVSFCRFRMTRAWGACLIAMYLSFTLLSILMESGLVPGGEG